MLKRVIMLGTAPDTHGGISAVVNAWRDQGWFERWPIEYVVTHRDGTPGQKLLAALRGLAHFAWLLLRDGRAVVHVHCASRASFWRKSAFLAISVSAACPILFHVHGGGFRRFYESGCGPLQQRLIRFFLARAARVIVLSEAMRAWVQAIVPGARVACVPNPAPLNAPQGPGAPRDIVLFVGRIERAKGVFDLLEAFHAVRGQLPGITLVCAGEGEREELARRAAELGVPLLLPGWVEGAAVRDLLHRAAAFVLPSYAEGQPMSLLEAMAAGTPVVASSVGGIPELVAHRETGLLIASGDQLALQEALRKVLLDRAASRRMANAARAAVLERHAPQRVLEMLADVYRDAGLATAEASRAGVRGLREAA